MVVHRLARILFLRVLNNCMLKTRRQIPRHQPCKYVSASVHLVIPTMPRIFLWHRCLPWICAGSQLNAKAAAKVVDSAVAAFLEQQLPRSTNFPEPQPKSPPPLIECLFMYPCAAYPKPQTTLPQSCAPIHLFRKNTNTSVNHRGDSIVSS